MHRRRRPVSHRVSCARSPGSGYAVDLRGARHAWTLDEPGADGGTDRGPDPITALLGALLSCMTITFKAAAARRNIAIERIDGDVSGNPAGRLTEVSLTLEVWSPVPEAELRKVLDRAERGCYVSRALGDEVAVSVALVVGTTAG